MRSVTGSMTNVVKGMDAAMKSMDLEKVRMMMLQQILCLREGEDGLLIRGITD